MVNRIINEWVLGLVYNLGLYNMEHVDLTENLGIKKQNINIWIESEKKTPEKYLPVLEDTFWN